MHQQPACAQTQGFQSSCITALLKGDYGTLLRSLWVTDSDCRGLHPLVRLRVSGESSSSVLAQPCQPVVVKAVIKQCVYVRASLPPHPAVSGLLIDYQQADGPY